MTENNAANTPAINGAGEAVIATPKPRATRAKRTAPAKAAGKASTSKATAKAKAPAKAAGKAAGKAKAAPKKEAAQGVLATKSGVSHPGPLWLKAMHDKGLSQTACANEMGVAPMTLNRLINGHGIPTARVTLAFAKATKQQPKKVWQQVCDFELALAMEADEQAGK